MVWSWLFSCYEFIHSTHLRWGTESSLLQELKRVQPLENKHTPYLIINEFDFGFSVLIIWHSGKIKEENYTRDSQLLYHITP